MNQTITINDVPENLRECDGARIKGFMQANWTPHQPAVDEVMLAKGALTKEAFDSVGCGGCVDGKRCGRSHEQHTCDTLVVVELKRTVTETELLDYLRQMNDWMFTAKIDGWVLQRTDFTVEKQ